MSQALVCDGCGALVATAESRGRLRRLDYCAGCAGVVDDYAEAVRKLHLSVAGIWEEGIARIKSGVEEKCPGIKLPL